ncbi:MAG: hypothetical protein NUW01_17385 [Gemmatimonadaceae bacterium]|nr:hypothetical protein [Gemmatimonadaceae bacterium]
MQPFFRPTLLAVATVGIVACGDTPTEPVKPTEVTLKSCGGALPWVGYQDGDGEWIEVQGVPTGTAYSYKFTMAQRLGGVAYVVTTTCGRYTDVVYGSADELATLYSYDCGTPAANTKTVHGTLVGGVAGHNSTVSLGFTFASVFGESGSYTLDRVADGPQDLVAFRGNTGGADKVILRRRVDFANGAIIPSLDFTGSEAFAMDSAKLSIQQFAAPGYVSSAIYLVNGRQFSTYAGSASATTWYRGFPASATIAGDLHGIGVTSAGRSVGTIIGPVANHTVSLGPAAATPTITTVSSGTPMRKRMTIPVQSQYSGSATGDFETGTRPYFYVDVTMTAAYRGSAKSWVLEVPDFGTSSGYNPAWGLQPSSREIWSSAVYDYNFLGKFVPAIGLTLRSASASSSSATPSAQPSFYKSGGQQFMLPTSIDARYEQQSCSS